MQDPIQRTWPVFAGVDWGGDNHQLCVVAPDGKRLLETRVSHDVDGLRQLDHHLNSFGPQIPIAIERSEGLLVEHLQATGHAVFPVSPRISARARERYKVAAVKDDRFDAFVLADTLRFDHARWRPLSVPSPLLAEIKALTRDRDRLLETQQATERQLRMILEAYHPAPVRLFSSVLPEMASVLWPLTVTSTGRSASVFLDTTDTIFSFTPSMNCTTSWDLFSASIR